MPLRSAKFAMKITKATADKTPLLLPRSTQQAYIVPMQWEEIQSILEDLLNIAAPFRENINNNEAEQEWNSNCVASQRHPIRHPAGRFAG